MLLDSFSLELPFAFGEVELPLHAADSAAELNGIDILKAQELVVQGL